MISAKTLPHASDLAPRREPAVDDGIPRLPLRRLLDLAGELLRGLPQIVLVEATIVACKQNRNGFTLELTEAGSAAGQGASLRAFLSQTVLTRVSEVAGGIVDPTALVGMTTVLKIAPVWSARYQLGARLIDLGREAMLSLARQRIELLRAALRREGLYDRQRRLPSPKDVTRLSVVHPAGAAGLADIAAELAQWEKAGLLAARFHAAVFEGATAPQVLTKALRDAVQPIAGAQPDIVLLVRGGGARTGLEILDQEVIARAVAGCSVPVICGCGHAIDRALVDELAWRTCDTPSKAVAMVARLMRTPAMRAQADMVTITDRVERHLANARTALTDRWTAIARLTTRRETDARGSVAASWADLRIAVRGAEASCERLAIEARQERNTILAQTILTLDAASRGSRDLARNVITLEQQRLDRADGGERAWHAVQRAAGTRLDLASSSLTRLRDSVSGAAISTLDRAADGLAVAEAIVAASSVETTLSRGFALVIDPQGRVIRTVADAQAARDVTLHLHDGSVAAGVRS